MSSACLTASNKRSRSSRLAYSLSLHAGHVPADQLDGFIYRFLPPTRDEDVSSLFNEQLGTGQRHTA